MNTRRFHRTLFLVTRGLCRNFPDDEEDVTEYFLGLGAEVFLARTAAIYLFIRFGTEKVSQGVPQRFPSRPCFDPAGIPQGPRRVSLETLLRPRWDPAGPQKDPAGPAGIPQGGPARGPAKTPQVFPGDPVLTPQGVPQGPRRIPIETLF